MPLTLKPMSACVAFLNESVTRLARSVLAGMSVKVLGRSCGVVASGWSTL